MKFPVLKSVLLSISSFIFIVGLSVGWVYLQRQSVQNESQLINETGDSNTSLEVSEIMETPTERYIARPDRVKVVFEQWDYTRFRLQTNDVVLEGELNTERGYGDDLDATVYILNWMKPANEQILYVRLTAEPGYLYELDKYRNIINSVRLTLE
jgi:hypothetical protein